MPLSAGQQVLLSAVDGQRSIREILAVTEKDNNGFEWEAETQESVAQRLFQELRSRDFLTFAIKL